MSHWQKRSSAKVQENVQVLNNLFLLRNDCIKTLLSNNHNYNTGPFLTSLKLSLI